ncbi:MAG TPA: ABC transporter permease [Gemmatimonadaceae bacterium]|nr:ABC transporter permease [Gemmatimonadaceae bacterium]
MARPTPLAYDLLAASRLDPPPGDVAAGTALLVKTVWRHGTARAGVSLILALLLVALLAPWLAPYDPAAQLDIIALKNQAPSMAHPFGTDVYGRDVLSRMIYGTRVSLSVAMLAMLLSTFIGTAYGLTAALGGRAVDMVLMRGVDALLSIPRILLLLGVVALWGTLSVGALIVVIGLSGWFGAARLVRTQVLTLRERDFVTAARGLGAGTVRVAVRHILPHVASPVLVAATFGVGAALVIEAGLSFLGFGVAEPQASWGSILRDGREFLVSAWWLTFIPGAALVITVLGFNVIADRLRDIASGRHLLRP